MFENNYKYILLKGNLYNVDFSIITLLYWIFLRKKYTTLKQKFSLLDIIIAKIGYIKIKFSRLSKQNDRIFELPYGHVGIKVRGNGIRVFDFKNEILYRNQMGQRERYLINHLPFSAKINGRSGEFYKEVLIDGATLDQDLNFDNTTLEEIYLKYIRCYILKNANLNKPTSISLLNYKTKLKDKIECFYSAPGSIKNDDYIYSSLLRILEEISDYDKLEIPITISHGDISPRNIIIANRKFTLIDGEYINYRSLFYDIFDYFYQTNQIIVSVNINPKQIGINKSLEILTNLEYEYDSNIVHIFWKLYIINRMLLVMNNVSNKKSVSKQLSKLIPESVI